MNILDFFLWGLGFHKGKKCWNYADLYYNITRGNGALPQSLDRLPYCLSMQNTFWQKTKELHEYTLKDGHEYAVSVWWAAGDVVVTPPERGDTESVTSNYTLSIQYDPVDSVYASKTVSVNGQVVFTQSIRYEDIQKEGKSAILFHLHTHPPYYIGETQPENRRYAFFSAVDIQSFLLSNSAIFGVITDKVYLMIKPSNVSKKYQPFSDHDITPEFLTSVLGIAVYEGSWDNAVFERIGVVR
jgi:hypothetical protein